jgi:predicted nuclease of predicted toxin-antitoxin system
MKILVDENIPWMTVQELRAKGHDVRDIRGSPEEGMEDQPLWETVQREGRLLVTTDKGFMLHRGELHHGILVVRLRQPNRRKIHQRVMRIIDQFEPREWQGLVVVARDTAQSMWRAHEGGA